MPPKEKLKIVIGAAPPHFQNFAGGFPRPALFAKRAGRNAFELIQEYSTNIRCAVQIRKRILYLCVCLTKSEPFLNGTDGPATAGRQTECSGGQKGRGLESGRPPGIFARPRFPPPPNFVFHFAKCAAICLLYNCSP